MLNKPTMPVPFNTIVNTGIDIDRYKFSCELFNDNVNEVDLFINDNRYQLENGKDFNITNKKLTMTLTSGSSYGTGMGTSTRTFNGLNTPVTYRWKVRQVGSPDVDENINIGYGFTQTGGTWQIKHNPAKPTSSNYYDALKFYIYKIRPHTDMYEFLPNTSEIQNIYRTWVNMDYLNQPATLSEEKYTNKNDNISYWINVGDNHIKILGYFYGFETSVFKPSGSTIMLHSATILNPETKNTTMSYNPELEVDDYGNPLFAYVITDSPISGSTINKRNMIDVEYSITTNYIDSDEFTFKTRTKPNLNMSDFDTNINDYMYEDSNTNTYSPNKSVINLTLEYYQTEGGYISQHQTKLYDITVDPILLVDTGVVFDDSYLFKYNLLLPNRKYRLDIYLTDSDGRNLIRHIDILPNYDYTPLEIGAATFSAYYLQPRHSCVIHINNFTPQANIDHFEIYKIVGEKSKMYYVGTMPLTGDNYLEDYIVGSLCDYQYYICPVTLVNNSQNVFNIINVISTVDITNSDTVAKNGHIKFNNQTVRVIGLKQDAENPNLFSIDQDNIWTLDVNVKNDGFSHTIGKTYTDTLSRFPVEVKGNSFYRSMNLEGMLGKINCKTNEFSDTYDNIIDWEKFVNNGELKAVIDLRGIITIGTFDSNNFVYQETKNHEVSVNIAFKQLMDETEVTILGRNTDYVPGSIIRLFTKDNEILFDINNNMLYAYSES